MLETDSSPHSLSVSDVAQPPLAVSAVVIEDNRLLREGITAMLRGQEGFTVLGASGDVPQILREIPALRPSVVLLDFGLGDDDSLDICARVRTLVPDSRVVVMGISAPQEDVAAFIRAGAAGFIMKDATPDEFVSTIRVVAAGEQALPRSLTQSLFAQIMRGEIVSDRAVMEEGIRLTIRECQIVDLLGEGLSNKEIAAQLHVAVHTVKSHVHNILEKLSLHTRLEIAAYARRAERHHEW